ncbi:MAG: CBS domain-containing protein [Chloroflexi bacterium]|nr:CBS domain-containing protein [Chloroflexota bacterium]
MRIILTHEQADFDALASLLGAHLIDEAALPVLPRRLNRNVRAFVTLYGLELPFIDPRDLPKEKVETTTLVDTQSLISVKGMGAHTSIFVVDHHHPRPDVPEKWSVTTEEIGATTTLFVEALQERNESLSMPQATLLLLGIYEDTGSLTYKRTSPRDVRAAAHLLEQGASLQIAVDFLNHPLSEQQQKLYEELRSAAQTHSIFGHSVVVASGDASKVEEELSAIVHKLHDLMDPDAIIALFTTRTGIQMIGRSTTDYINVAEITEYFGGGGHNRAAAALITGRELKDVQNNLMDTLQKFVQPSITVAQIMSSDPQLLSPNTPVKEAADLMQRYGYEGYPVVEKGKVVGLLTRRAVDRAVAHKLKVTASELMDAGEVTIAPDESIETLQRRMTDTGWGQIPVISPNKNKVVGIVTRTDLLKTLTSETTSTSPQNISNRLEKALPAARLALLKMVAQAANSQQTALYIVGGFVRDLLMERPSLDYDLVVEGDAIALANVLVETYGGRLTTHRRFGTAKWQISAVRETLAKQLGNQVDTNDIQDLPETLDLISARREFYTHPTALPTVERGSIKLDLHRRDFTINTLALRLDGSHYGELQNYWGGLNDLNNGIVRVLHSLSFVDDPTRILRAVRFEQRFGFKIGRRTFELLMAALSLLDRVSGDRIRHELDAIWEEVNSQQIITRLSEMGVLTAIHPDLVWDKDLASQIENLPRDTPQPEWGLEGNLDGNKLWPGLAYTVWIMRLPRDKVSSISKRLRLPGNLQNVILETSALAAEINRLESAAPSEIDMRLLNVPPLALYVVYLTTPKEKIRQILYTYVTEWSKFRVSTSGHDLREHGLPPGPEYQRILKALRAAWLDGEVKTKDEEIAMLEMLLNE